MKVHELIEKLQGMLERGEIEPECGIFFEDEWEEVNFINSVLVDSDGDLILGG